MQVKDMRLGRHADPERIELVAQLARATNRLDAIAVKRSELALAAARGDPDASSAMNALDVEAADRGRDVETFVLAIQAFDREREKAANEKQEARLAKAAERRKKLLDAQEAEQTQYLERHIARLDACGDKDQARRWREQLANLRQTLEKQMPLPKGA